MKIRLFLAVLAVAVCAVLPLSAAPILNGSFETGTGSAVVIGGGVRCYDTGNCDGSPGTIQSWTILGDVDYVGSYWQAAEGNRSVDLAGGVKSPGVWSGVSQTFSTVPGWMYGVSFYLSGNPDGGSQIKSLVVEAEGQTGNFTFNTSGITHGSMGWLLTTWYFTAGDDSATLLFRTQDSAYGPAIDNVSVAMIPEPASMLLLGAGIFALAGLARYRRRR